ncbi:hypothetical protein [Arcobacter sp. CECT 8985]|uniref:hypothetical protein n=1 Tax=Arcobacter sp. CECT 8985 TaxID=1935424 RepID=UPI0013E982E5|nr:hypothetical protein [Arcobacter sp. CECT 8985]
MNFFCFLTMKLKHELSLLLIKLFRLVEIFTKPIKRIQNLLIQDKNFIMAAI